jgi:hypothetical protein
MSEREKRRACRPALLVPEALLPEEKVLLGFVRAPLERGDHILSSGHNLRLRHRREIVEAQAQITQGACEFQDSDLRETFEVAERQGGVRPMRQHHHDGYERHV